MFLRNHVCLAFLAGLQLACAFVPPASPVKHPSITIPIARSISMSSLYSSNGSSDEDELSKLIGKRSQIKRQKAVDVEEAVKSLEPTVDLDLDKLPNFKTERPVRKNRPKRDEEKEESPKGKSQKEEESPIVDFMAEYEDENDFHVPNRIGVSTACWGDPTRNFVGSGKLTKRMVKAGKFVPGDLQLAYNKLLEGGITVLETSAAYGAVSRKQKLSAQDILNRCVDEQEEGMPETLLMESLGGPAWTKAISSGAIVSHLQSSCERLNTDAVQLYQVPKSFLFPGAILANGLAAAMDSGYCNYVGVRGITSARALRRFCRRLDDRGFTLTSNAFDFSLTNPKAAGMFDACRESGVIPFVTNPLDFGLASGVFTATNPSGGQVAGSNQFSFKELEKLQPLHSVQESIAERVRTRVIREMRDTQDRFKSRYGPPPKINTDITTTQVALNYVIAKGGVPLPEVNNPKDAEEVLGCLGWTLSDDEVDMLDAAISLCRLK